ncbi:zinc finger BED domain-containing protein 4-like isoform X2 [Oratosquilla oratoria]|uniref:zinc finger BED domain-containing protein 4-like isoform X2 n=1 Tax=Oratosquilla oratoria TaxID=337810 RepID=UPI003F766037
MAPPKKLKSEVWLHFRKDPLDDSIGICTHCGARTSRGKDKRKYTTTNFHKHLERCLANPVAAAGGSRTGDKVHSSLRDEILHCVTNMLTDMKWKPNTGSLLSSSSQQRSTASDSITKHNYYKVSQEEVNSALMTFIVQGIHPVSLVEDPAFKNLVKTLNSDIDVMSQHELVHYIKELELDQKEKIKARIQQQQYICSSIDIWSTSHHGFLSIAAHWIDGVTLERHGAALGCCRVMGSHTYGEVAERFEEINSEFEILDAKVVSTVSDNYSNFAKTLREFGVKLNPNNLEENKVYFNSTSTGTLGVDEDLIFAPAFEKCELFEENTQSNYHLILPNHVSCASNLLSLVASIDAKDALKNEKFATLTHVVMEKCSALWNRTSHKKSADLIQQIIGCSLSSPSPKHWNSLFNSISTLLKHKLKLNSLMTSLQLPVFLSHEFEYLEEFKTTLAPIAKAIDHLQGSKGSYYGELIPTLLTAERQLEQTQAMTFNYCTPLLSAVILGFKNRFGKYLNLDPHINEAVLATVTHPYFKLRWIRMKESWDVQDTTYAVQETFMRTARGFKMNVDENASPPSCAHDDYFSFDKTPSGNSTSETQEMMVLTYLQDPDTNLKSLHNHPLIRAMFIKFNTTIPSSTPVERLFSFHELSYSSTGEKYLDNIFETMVLIKANT